MDDTFAWILTLLDSTIRLSIPLIFAAMGGICSERSGTVDIGLEGKMLASAFAAAAVSAVTGSAYLGLMVAIMISMSLSLVHSFATVHQRGDHIISGLAINFFASGMTITLGAAWFAMGGQTPALKGDQRFTPINLPGADWMAENASYVGIVYKEIISGHTLLTYLAFISVFAISFILFKTTFGLRLRAVGEEPNAVDTAGISVTKLRYQAQLMTGFLCGFSGAYLSLAQNAGFGREMSAGQGYIALAAVIFGKWKPRTTLFACLLFGLLTALEARMQGVEVFGTTLPTQLFSALPYILTVVLLAGFIGTAIAPKAVGKPYVKER